MRGKAAAGALAAVALALVGAVDANACSCAPQSPSESLREADAAVVGRLVRVMPHGAFHAVYRYELRRVYKGGDVIDAERMLDVRSARRSAACALPRRVDRTYGLFLRRAHGRWYGGICGVVAPRRLRHAARGAATTSARAPAAPVPCG